MLTPLDIHNKEFKKGLRGYDVNDVDEFLDEIIRDFESLYKENLELKEQLMKQQDDIDRYKTIEDTLQSTMVLAQKTAEEAIINSEKEAELLIAEARQKAEGIVSGSHNRVTECLSRVQELKAYEKQIKLRLKGFLTTQLQMMDDDYYLDGVEKDGAEIIRDEGVKEDISEGIEEAGMEEVNEMSATKEIFEGESLGTERD